MGTDTIVESQEGFSEKVAYLLYIKNAGTPYGVTMGDVFSTVGSTI